MHPRHSLVGSRPAKLAALVVLLCGGLSAHAAPVPKATDPQPAPPLPRELIAEWEKAGAKAGWIGLNVDGWISFSEKQAAVTGAVPAFQFANWDEVALAKLRAPETPFGLAFVGGQVPDAGLKAVAKFKTLQALILGNNPVTDAGVKELTA